MGLFRSWYNFRKTNWVSRYALGRLRAYQEIFHRHLSSAQLQKHEDSAPESLEFERLKEHFDPFLRTSSLSSSLHLPTLTPHLHTSSVTAAASAALARDIPGVGKCSPLVRSRSGRDRTVNKDEMSEYKSRVEVGLFSQLGGDGDDMDVELLRHSITAEEIAKLEQRWGSSWVTPLRTRCAPPCCPGR